jgi:hypothetical protein
MWHLNCFVVGIADENHFTMLLWRICVQIFARGAIALTMHPEWFAK